MKRIFDRADILLPQNCDMAKWSVVACDQFSSQPEYWDALERGTSGVPSALHLMFPEAYLETRDQFAEAEKINAEMERYLDAGVTRVILGSAAIENPQFMESLAKQYPGKVAAGVDAKNGFVAIHGWKTITDIVAYDFVESLPQRGIDTVIYTDISRDGKLQGPKIGAYERLSQIKDLQIVASGGVSSPEDIAALAKLNLYAAIIGKALYDGRITLEQALETAKG